MTFLFSLILSILPGQGYSPLTVEMRVQPPNGKVCITITERDSIDGSWSPSCWTQNDKSPAVAYRRIILYYPGDFKVGVTVDGVYVGKGIDVKVLQGGPD